LFSGFTSTSVESGFSMKVISSGSGEEATGCVVERCWFNVSLCNLKLLETSATFTLSLQVVVSHILPLLRKQYGTGVGETKGIATIRLPDGTIRLAEVHWFERTALVERNENQAFLD